jgi:quinol monooxygenase YgiN
MIFITAKFRIKPEHADDWPSISGSFTQATRAEEGCLWFDWSRSVDDPTEYVLVEAFRDEAAAVHVQSAHFAQAQTDLPGYLVETPRIVNFAVPGDDWSELGELAVKD